ncbi:hypothetical protein AGMMS49545_24090 [Betaproteobacteria bacterium]|nr:hypothetical protein AGMMS49545_24090 [Betaproteobacteria bacterium]
MAELSYSMKMTLDAIKLVSGANEARDALQKTFDGASAKARQAEKAFQEASAALQNIKADPDASKAIIDRATEDAADSALP